MILKSKDKIVRKLALRVLAEALARLGAYPWQVAIISDGAAQADIEALMAPLGEDRVRFLEQRGTDELPVPLNAADLYVNPAVREAHGVALHKPQAAGVPVVAGDAGGIAVIIRHGITGVQSPEGNLAALADAIVGLLADPARRGAMGTAAQTKFANEHSLEAASDARNYIVTAAQWQRAA